MATQTEEQISQYMSDEKLLTVVRQEVDASLGWTGTRLTKARQRNLDEWFGNPRGDEIPGRSQASSRVVYEQVEQVMPTLIETFVGGSEVCRFIARNPDDEDSAKAATTACNYVFEQCDGPSVLQTMFRDALIQRNGIVKVYWDDGTEGYLETYEGKTLEEVMLLSEDPDFEFKESTMMQWVEGELVEVGDETQVEMIDQSQLRFTIVGLRRPDNGRVRIENVAPENFLINRDAKGLHDPTCRFVAQRIRTSVSNLIASGIDPAIAENLPSATASTVSDMASAIRSSQQDSAGFDYVGRKDSERMVRVTEAYVLTDRDGDGVSEWWRVMVAGDYSQSFINAEPADGHPFASVTPVPVPHRFFGLSIADAVSDIGNIQTTLWRSYLDSLYLNTDPRMVVLSQGTGETAVPMANLDQLLDASPGSYVEEYAPNAIRPLATPTNAQHMLPALSLHAEMLKARTGITPEGQGMDPNAINKTAYGVMVQQSASAQRVTMIARIFADTGVKQIFKLIYKNLLQHQFDEFQVQVSGSWVAINPSDWATNLDAQISVGLGHGTRMEKVSNLQTLAAVQKELLEGGMHNMVSQENLYATVESLVEALGFKDASRFVTDPAQNPPQPKEPDTAEKAIEVQQQIELMKLEVDRQRVEIDRYKAMANFKRDELDHEVDVAKLRLEGSKLAMDEPWSPKLEPEAPVETEEEILSQIDAAMLAAAQQGQVAQPQGDPMIPEIDAAMMAALQDEPSGP